MDMTFDEYIDFINHLFMQRMDDSEYLDDYEYLAFMRQSNLGEM